MLLLLLACWLTGWLAGWRAGSLARLTELARWLACLLVHARAFVQTAPSDTLPDLVSGWAGVPSGHALLWLASCRCHLQFGQVLQREPADNDTGMVGDWSYPEASTTLDRSVSARQAMTWRPVGCWQSEWTLNTERSSIFPPLVLETVLQTWEHLLLPRFTGGWKSRIQMGLSIESGVDLGYILHFASQSEATDKIYIFYNWAEV